MRSLLPPHGMAKRRMLKKIIERDEKTICGRASRRNIVHIKRISKRRRCEVAGCTGA